MDTPTPSQSKRILIIEDDLDTLQAATIKLRHEGFQVESATDGIMGIEKLDKDQAFDAILLDIRMPKGDGFNFLEKKAEDPRFKDIPVIIFTNLSQREFVDRALQLGAKGYLVKAHHSIQEIVEELTKCVKTGQCRIDV